MGQGPHEICHVELVERIGLQDGHEVQEVLVASQQPSNVHDFHFHLRVHELLFVRAEGKELFFRQTFEGQVLNLLLIQCR